MPGDISALQFRLLGPLEVTNGGRPVRLSAGKLHVLLATLLVNANQVVSIEELTESLWGEDVPADARRTVQVYAVRLRRALGDDASSPRLVHTRPTGYAIEVEPDRLDLTAFRQLRAEATAAEQAGEQAAASGLLAEALGLWRGPALSGVRSEALHRDVVPRLAEERLLAIEHRLDLELRLGRHREVVSELVQLTSEHTWREEFWAQLVLALHRSGRQADAHAAYRKVRDLLRAELGVDPGERLRQLHQLILRAEPEDGGDDTGERTAVSQLPLGVRRFVGRADLTAVLTRLLCTDVVTPIVAISGPPGVGKTALALHVAHGLRDRFGDGHLYLNLRGYSAEPPVSASAALTRLLGDLGVPPGRQPVELEDQAALYRSLLSGRRFLVVLDNADHPEQVRPLLPATAGCAVLVTSRNDLRGLSATHSVDHVPLGVLTEEESVAVLMDLIGARGESGAVAELARSCAYLPLALRIAGANLAASPHRDVADYTDELSRHGRVAGLVIDGDELAAVRTAFDLSYLRLLPEDRALFRLLGQVMPSPDFRVVAAAAAAGRPVSGTVPALERLTRANLLQQPTADTYQFHDLIREYAADRARDEDGDEMGAAAARLFDFYLRSADSATRRLYPGVPLRVPLPGGDGPSVEFATESAALRWLDDERQNLLTVAAAGDCRGWQLIDVLRAYLQARGHAVQAVAVCEAVLRAAERAGDHRAQASVLDVLGQVSFNMSDYDRAIASHDRALRAARQVGDLDAEANCLHNLGRVYAQLGRPELAMRAHIDALAVSERTGNRDAVALALNYVGVAHLSFGDAHRALDWHERALALSRETGNRPTTARALNGVGLAYWTLGRLDEAIRHHQQSLAISRELGFRYGEAVELVCLAETNCDAGRLDLAAEQAAEAIAGSREIGERRNETGGLEILAAVAHRRGRLDEAIAGYRHALRLATEISFGYGEVSILLGLSRALRERRDPAQALAHARRAWAKVRASGMLVLLGPALTEVAHAYLDLGTLDLADEHAREAVEVTGRADHRLAQARALHVLGLVCQTSGDTCAAAGHWRAALDLFTAAGTPEAARLTHLLDATCPVSPAG